MKTKFFTLILCIFPVFLSAQNYEKEGDDLYAQGKYEQAVKKYNAAISLVGESATINNKIANAKKCNTLLAQAKTAADNATTISEYENASKLYLDLYSVHALSSYKSKAQSLQQKADYILEQRQAEQAERERQAKEERERQARLEAEQAERERLAKAERERQARLEAEQRAQNERQARLAAEQRKIYEAQRREEEERQKAKKRAEERIAEFMKGYKSIGKCAVGTYLNMRGIRVKANNLPYDKKKVKIIKKDNLFPITYEISVSKNGIKCIKYEFTGGALTSAIPKEVVGKLNEGYMEFSISGECKISKNYDPELSDLVWVKVQ